VIWICPSCGLNHTPGDHDLALCSWQQSVMKIRLVIRGYLGKVRQWQSSVELTEENLENLLPDLAESHCEAMAAGTLDMIEIEFLDDPDPNRRFLRIGTNPDGIVYPLRFNLNP
jgi:hypothetical protein